MVTERFSVFLVRPDPATGAETAKTRPSVVVSPDELNRAVSTCHHRTNDHGSVRLADAGGNFLSRQSRRNCFGSEDEVSG
jgi:mRNA-degrading endonuclease toxin of MazEF toxin-antitoxin module